MASIGPCLPLTLAPNCGGIGRCGPDCSRERDHGDECEHTANRHLNLAESHLPTDVVTALGIRCHAAVARSAYLTRFQTASIRAPVVVAGFVYINSSAVRLVIIRFSTSPSEFGNVLPSVLKLMVLSASLIEYVPK